MACTVPNCIACSDERFATRYGRNGRRIERPIDYGFRVKLPKTKRLLDAVDAMHGRSPRA